VNAALEGSPIKVSIRTDADPSDHAFLSFFHTLVLTRQTIFSFPFRQKLKHLQLDGGPPPLLISLKES